MDLISTEDTQRAIEQCCRTRPRASLSSESGLGATALNCRTQSGTGAEGSQDQAWSQSSALRSVCPPFSSGDDRLDPQGKNGCSFTC